MYLFHAHWYFNKHVINHMLVKYENEFVSMNGKQRPRQYKYRRCKLVTISPVMILGP